MIKPIAKAKFPSSFGKFTLYAFKEENKEHLALVCGKLKEPVLVRVHSKCLTGDNLHSLRCDCNAQLEYSLKQIGKKGGILIYLDQEGRGIGLLNKIKAYSLQDQGFDTVEANHQLGFQTDERTYRIVKEILDFFQISLILLLTNNPEKINQIKQNGIKIAKRMPIIIPKTKYNKKYLETKKKKMGHLI